MDLTSAHSHVLLLLCNFTWYSLFPPADSSDTAQRRWLDNFHLTPTPLCRVAPHSYRRMLGFDDYLLERLVWLGKRFECAGMFITQHRFIQLFCRAWDVFQIFLGLCRGKSWTQHWWLWQFLLCYLDQPFLIRCHELTLLCYTVFFKKYSTQNSST